uniref:Uncharacterized protein n=1 Tax=Favella ehrenbergii TaxID=182087 RepID=A0A7S3HU92_9SPIT|mmetsp:Transcript_10715/g.13362  ORF Transcript_10715/g.13362 Transcript_10715/m.13362 type:complete len:133 (+) Transcript_10715:1905-2303(+)|eukprot:CAMPEP_0170452548 /NCGR_PEP_ID=MMETSP0123-20130129/1406_1 /TAXON_ID=182087 /ORGANISM="Favella ehrenbergii, Strain Fehren 1" /LENGTH=132 /DNA_ID=CAMNT_0010714583 /DNA_START=1847 /DNA_END=2245 /DNA_ORIENTATION=+
MGIDDDAEYARITHESVAGLEDSDSDEELFKRRMGLRSYLNQLKNSLVRVRNAKRVKEEAMQAAATADEETKGTLDELDTKEASAFVEISQKVGATASITNPPAPAKKKKGTAKGAAAKKKGVAKKKASTKK